MSMDKISKSLSDTAKYQRLSRPLTAAKVCDTARELANDRFEVVSFKDGLLTVGVENSSAAANLQMENDKIIKEINQKLDQELVKRLRFKIQ